MKKIIALLFIFQFSISQNNQTKEILVNELITGTLFTKDTIQNNSKLVILIAGSGPTDRNGNVSGMENNSLKFLAESIANEGNDCFSFDKRLFAQFKNGTLDEEKLRFDDFINDVKDIINYFKSNYKYKKIIIVGHSEGSLIGMVAAKENADAFISIAGPARPIDQIISEQILAQLPNLKNELNIAFETIKSEKKYSSENQTIMSILRESVQPYLCSWIKYNPQDEIKKLNIPILILNGTSDLQVSENEAKLLKEAQPKAELELIEKMNHVLKNVNNQTENANSYSNPSLPIATELSTSINNFIKNL